MGPPARPRVLGGGQRGVHREGGVDGPCGLGSLAHEVPLEGVPEAYEKFDERVDGYTKVLIKPGMAA